MLKDPLANFNWPELYKLYDDKCVGYDPSHIILTNNNIEANSDRELYYLLKEQIRNSRNNNAPISFATYASILYWKLNSQPNNSIFGRIFKERSNIEKGLLKLKEILPERIAKTTDVIKNLIYIIGETELLGIKSFPSLPTRSTLLHYIFPDIIPIYDKMVAQAVGYEDDNANQNIQYFMNYIEHNWMLCDRYRDKVNIFSMETPVRVIDMALWIEGHI